MVKVGIIGGSGLYDPEILEDAQHIKAHTPFGRTSDLVTTGKFKGVDLVFIPRHGSGHMIHPTDVNSRANVWAMKQMGVTHLITSSAVGSLKEEYKPGHLVIADQFIDRTHHRKQTFYEGNQVCHIPVAEPCCPQLREILNKTATELKLEHHKKGTCVVIEGPRFSTKAESNVFRQWNADIIGMTMVPEAVLAREAEMCYATIAMVTDYDVWKEHHVSLDEVIKTMKNNVEKVKKLLGAVIPKIEDNDCECRQALKCALI